MRNFRYPASSVFITWPSRKKSRSAFLLAKHKYDGPLIVFVGPSCAGGKNLLSSQTLDTNQAPENNKKKWEKLWNKVYLEPPQAYELVIASSNQ